MLTSKLAVMTQKWDLGSVFDSSVTDCLCVRWYPEKAMKSCSSSGTEWKAPFHCSVLHPVCCLQFWFHISRKAAGMCWGGITTCLQKRAYEVKLTSFERRRLRSWLLPVWCLRNCGCSVMDNQDENLLLMRCCNTRIRGHAWKTSRLVRTV